MKRCSECGRIMRNHFDGEAVVAECTNDECYAMIKTRIIDFDATERFWDNVDAERIKEDSTWAQEIKTLDNKCHLCAADMAKPASAYKNTLINRNA